MPHFFVKDSLEGQRFALLDNNQSAHAKVLRIAAGDHISVSDSTGALYSCVVSDVSNGQVSLVIGERSEDNHEAKVDVLVYMAFSKGDKFEHVIQKATELGAAEIVGFPSSRCVAKYDSGAIKKKLPRWEKIAEAAAEQSGRSIIPRITVLQSYEAAVQRASEADCAIFFYENERSHTLTEVLSKPHKSIAIITGPEGGFSPEETAIAENHGLDVCTLGKRILRCETAPLCALSAIMYASGEF